MPVRFCISLKPTPNCEKRRDGDAVKWTEGRRAVPGVIGMAGVAFVERDGLACITGDDLQERLTSLLYTAKRRKNANRVQSSHHAAEVDIETPTSTPDRER